MAKKIENTAGNFTGIVQTPAGTTQKLVNDEVVSELPTVTSRPTGAPASAAVDITHMTPAERNIIQTHHGLVGQQIQQQQQAQEAQQAQQDANAISNPDQSQQQQDAAMRLQQEQGSISNIGQTDFTALQPKTQQGVERGPMQQPQQQGFLNTAIFGPKDAQGKALLQGGTAGLGLGAAGAVAAEQLSQPVFSGISKLSTSLKVFSGLSIAGVIGALTGGRVRNIESDINDVVSSTRIVTAEVGKGANPYEALSALDAAEQNVRKRIADLNVAIKYSPYDRIAGKNTQEYAKKQLTIIVSRRMQIERAIVSGDFKSLNSIDLGDISA